MLYNGLPLYRATIGDDDMGMVAISLVNFPATECDFLKFNADKEPIKFRVEDEEKQIVYGLVMAANMPIYRRNGDFEWFIFYSPETIRTMAERYLKDGLQNRVDLNHNGVFEDGVNMVEFFIKDSKAGISPKCFEDYEDGSLFASFHVTNDDVWSKIKDGTYKGFSLEGYFSIEQESDEAFTEEDAFKKCELEDIDERDIEIILGMINKLKTKYKNIR